MNPGRRLIDRPGMPAEHDARHDGYANNLAHLSHLIGSAAKARQAENRSGGNFPDARLAAAAPHG